MNYELAKKLNDTGFPVPSPDDEMGNWIIDPDCPGTASNEYQACKGCRVYVPTLSELIEACGGRFQELHMGLNGVWGATSFTHVFSKGETPEEAVVMLWIKLNNK